MALAKYRAAVVLVVAVSVSWSVNGSIWAEETEKEVQLDDGNSAPMFDPWGAPVQRWPDLLSSQLGEDKTYYYWTREDRKSLLRSGTNQRPLNIWVGGDSLAGGAALGFRELVRLESRWLYTEDVRKSTGIVSDWYFDWEAYLDDEVANGPYEVIVISIGGNDWQGFRGGPTEKGSPDWVEKYRSRVTRILQILDRPGRLVIWVGMPHFRIPFMVPLPDAVNPITEEVFGDGERSSWIDAAAIVSPDGFWTKSIMDDDGKEIEVRTQDGTHYQSNGARLIVGAVVAAIEERTR
ncbi:MAG: DUF459 domain-containing protein [Actinomycetota bacterium]|nr:DUF459 domain-containing protein [Actinomycetota bacterium]MEE3257269.1 DUF459 domain-containing protein [Actinomycetota bacterium]